MRRVLLPLSVLIMLVLAACGSGPSTSPATSPGTPAASGSGCADVAKPAAKDPSVPEPSGSLPADKTVLLQLDTSCGRITITLDQAKNPKTANSVAHLARAGYYNDTTFHRVVPGFVIQGGDPEGTGAGGPPWKVTEAPPAGTTYDKGVVAMAKTQAEAAGTSGSQFFIVTGDGVELPADYAVAGRVTQGQDVADLIAAQGQEGSDGPPRKPVVITTATVVEQ